MTKKNVLLMWGGAGSEHEISEKSAAFIQSSMSSFSEYHVISVELTSEGHYVNSAGNIGQFAKETNSRLNKIIFNDNLNTSFVIDFVIPCFHGTPGESGDIQSWCSLIDVPFLGCNSEASILCFNKITTKLWLTALGIPNTPYIMMGMPSPSELKKASVALEQWESVFIKAATQGSSVGCYQVDDNNQLEKAIKDAFEYSPYVLIEKSLKARELEVAVYEYDGEVIATVPGEIVSPNGSFYTYEEKYHENSRSVTDIEAKNISDKNIELIKKYAIDAFIGLKLRHLSRIDFFLTDQGDIYLNEINTFPGMTPISMFPKMMEHNGHSFSEFIARIIRREVQ